MYIGLGLGLYVYLNTPNEQTCSESGKEKLPVSRRRKPERSHRIV